MNYRDLLKLKFLNAKYHGNRIDPIFVIMHHTAAPKKNGHAVDLSNYLANPGILSKKPSAHFHVNWDGEVTIYKNIIGLSDKWCDKANHAGVSKYEYQGIKYNGISNYSIGIEVAGDTNSYPLEKEQREALIVLCKWINQQFPKVASYSRWLRHADVAYPKGRKNDIGTKYFNWQEFKSNVFDSGFRI